MNKNLKMAGLIVGVVVFMVGMSYAAVPLYRVFCQVTGFAGTTQRADSEARVVLDRTITIRFDGATDPGLPWKFKPAQISQELKIGQTSMAYYHAENLSDQPIIGTATYNVVPYKAGLYFRKIACFCFTEQLLQPGEKVDMPMTYFIDPAIADDPNLDDVTTITISYAFARNEKAEQAQLASASQLGASESGEPGK